MNSFLTIKNSNTFSINIDNNNEQNIKSNVIEKTSKEKNKMEIEISSSMYNNALPVDDNFDID